MSEMPDVIYVRQDEDDYTAGEWRTFPWSYMPNDHTLLESKPYARIAEFEKDAILDKTNLGYAEERIAGLEGELAQASQLLKRLMMVCDNGQPKDCYVISRSGTLVNDVREFLAASEGGA